MQYSFWFGKLPWIRVGAVMFFLMLMLFDFKVALHRAGQPLDLLGLSVTNSEARAGNSYMATYGTKFVTVRSDVWTCFRIRDNVKVNFGFVEIPDRCQEGYFVVVQTEACKQVKSETIECTAGTWRWVPNPPCGTDSPTGWTLPPC